MMTRNRLIGWGIATCLLLTAVGAHPARAEVMVLDTTGLWRMHHTLEAPVLALDAGVTPMALRWTLGERLLQEFRWANRGTPPPADGWTANAFDDTQWLRGPARMSCMTQLLSRLCMRGKFEVPDPTKVRDLMLSVAYHGGVIVYLNGAEVARRDMAPAAAGREPLAAGYPPEAFTPANGWGDGSAAPDPKAQAALRRRTADVAVPSRLLQKGVNVLCLEIVRAPCHKVVEEMKGRRGIRYFPYNVAFNTCQVFEVRLSSPSAEGLVPNTVRPAGLQVWNTSMLCADYDLDFGDPGPLLPVGLVAARNGSFSGKVVVGSDREIRGLRAEAGPLSGVAGTIPAAGVRLRYGIPWGGESGVNGQRSIFQAYVSEYNCYARRPTMLGALAEQPPETVPVRPVLSGATTDLVLPGEPEPVAGAVVPVWITVDVPRTAAAGTYTGTVTIRAEGEAARSVPVRLEVADYTLPDPQDYRTVMELIESPDTLAIEYGVKPWSDEHFTLIGRSMKLMGEVGVPVVYIPLIAQTNLGNEESMVRWIPKGDEAYEWDFSVMDRYLDLAAKHLGKPKVVCFVAWDIYLGGAGGGYKDTWSHNQRSVELRKKYIGKGPLVTMLDGKTGQVSSDFVLPYDAPESAAAWKGLFAELRKRMAKRGWEKAMMIGLLSDDWPTNEERVFYADVTGGLPWVSHSHVPVTRGGKVQPDGIVVTAATAQGNAKVDRVGFRVGYNSAVLSDTFPTNGPPLGSLRGWALPDMSCYQPRYESGQPASRWRQLMEMNVTGRQRGIARGGADLWRAIRDRNGQRAGDVTDRYPQSAWRNLDIPWCVFAPGPTGPASTQRFEALREGIQECQPRILIEEALGDPAKKEKLGPDLARRCEEMLVARTEFMLKAIGHLQVNGTGGHLTEPPICRQTAVNGHRWFIGSGWEDRSREIYGLAGEVAAALGRPR